MEQGGNSVNISLHIRRERLAVLLECKHFINSHL